MTVTPAFPLTTYLPAGASTGPFATAWPYADDGDVLVFLNTGAGAVQLTLGVDFTLTSTNPLAIGGDVNLVNPPVGGAWPAGTTLTLRRSTVVQQTASLSGTTDFQPDVVEAALDNVVRQIQDLHALFAYVQSGGAAPAPANWATLSGIPPVIHAMAGLTAAAGKMIEFTGAATAHMIATPTGGGGGVGGIDATSTATGLTDAVDDAAAAFAGVDVGHFYFNGSIPQVRRS